MTITLKRNQLYADALRLPAGQLARKLGITPARLREACKAMDIPLPPLDHWNKLKAGVETSVPALLPYDGADLYVIGKPEREHLAEWVKRTMPSATAAALSPPPAPQQISRAGPKFMLLAEWAKAVFGEQAPHKNTLRRWVHEGRIQPPARKIGGRWWVTPAADYIED